MDGNPVRHGPCTGLGGKPHWFAGGDMRGVERRRRSGLRWLYFGFRLEAMKASSSFKLARPMT